jgi:hypothetical protein
MTEESDLVVFNQFEDVLVSLELAANLLSTDQRSTVLCKWLSSRSTTLFSAR